MSVADEVIWVHGGTTRHLGAPKAAQADRVFRAEFLGRR